VRPAFAPGRSRSPARRATAAISWACAAPAPERVRTRTHRMALPATDRICASPIRAQAECARGQIRERARRRISVTLRACATPLPACACLRPRPMARRAMTETRARKTIRARTARAWVVWSCAWRPTCAMLRARARVTERARTRTPRTALRATATERAAAACVSARWAKPFRVACACAQAGKKNVVLGLRRHHDGPERLRRLRHDVRSNRRAQ
jgi:hypothetical protein